VAIAVGLPREKEVVPAKAGLSAVARPVPASFGETRQSLGEGGKPSVVAKSTKPTRGHPIALEPPLPEVIIAADDVEAVRQFVNGARDRRFVATFEESPTPTAWAMNDLAIAPITIEPLEASHSHNN
jgi:hypothetical protein